jgi:hypothetical protein
MLKRFSIVLVLVAALSLVFVGGAYANFGPHGGYSSDTDACAGCHRAHTSFSTVGWTDLGGNPHKSALLVGNAQSMTEFCYACHGDYAPGASTNVASGIFDAGPSADSAHSAGGPSGTGDVGSTGATDSVVVNPTSYQTNSVFDAPLNGGGFQRMPDPYAWQTSATVVYKATTSAHRMDYSGPLWGAGSAVNDYNGGVGLTCTDCHDPHGSSNYRLLKDTVNNHKVGGYSDGTDGHAVDTPEPFVISGEQGYPVPGNVTAPGTTVPGSGSDALGGWLKHAPGAAQMAAYRPNYTDTTGTPIIHTEGGVPNASTVANYTYRSVSSWCAACHEGYNQFDAATAVTYNYNPNLPAKGSFNPNAGLMQVNDQDYHRHATDWTLAAGTGSAAPSGPRVLTQAVQEDQAWVPLERPITNDNQLGSQYIGCLTCHRAHGSSVSMSGYAASHLETESVNVTGTVQTVYMPVRDNVAGVDPDKGVYNGTWGQGSSALLRANNRGVCERCHNK